MCTCFHRWWHWSCNFFICFKVLLLFHCPLFKKQKQFCFLVNILLCVLNWYLIVTFFLLICVHLILKIWLFFFDWCCSVTTPQLNFVSLFWLLLWYNACKGAHRVTDLDKLPVWISKDGSSWLFSWKLIKHFSLGVRPSFFFSFFFFWLLLSS